MAGFGTCSLFILFWVTAPFNQSQPLQASTVPGGGALGQVSYGGVQLRGPNPYPILGKTGLRKHTLF